MKRFLLFSGEVYYAAGGWLDFADSYDSLEEALAVMALEAGDYNAWSHLVDSATWEIVARSSRMPQT